MSTMFSNQAIWIVSIRIRLNEWYLYCTEFFLLVATHGHEPSLYQKQQQLQLLIIFHQKEEPVPIAASARESISNPRLDLAEAQLMQCKGAC